MHIMLNRFVLGAIVGAVGVWVWGEDLRRLATARTHSAREAAADAIQSVQSTAEDLFDAAKDQVTSTLQAGEEAVRPHATRES
jgi:hypothetical protein